MKIELIDRKMISLQNIIYPGRRRGGGMLIRLMMLGAPAGGIDLAGVYKGYLH